jgi:ABC-type glycerol-3-phosphate transport system substrate-binding protein
MSRETRYGRLILDAACVVAVLSAIPLASCTATPAPAVPVTITFTYSRPSDDETYRGLARAFSERYPHVTVEVRPRSPEERADESTIDADVYWLTGPFPEVLREEGRTLGLGALMEQDLSYAPSDFYPGLLEALSFGGETWAAPAGIDVALVFYNRELFDEYDVPYPEVGWTWDDFLEKALALRDPDATVLGDASDIFGYGPSFPTSAFQFVYQHGGRIVDDLYAPMRATFDDPLTVDALEWYADLFHTYGVAPTLEQAAEAYGVEPGDVCWGFPILQGIQAGRVAMWDMPFSTRRVEYIGNFSLRAGWAHERARDFPRRGHRDRGGGMPGRPDRARRKAAGVDATEERGTNAAVTRRDRVAAQMAGESAADALPSSFRSDAGAWPAHRFDCPGRQAER